MRKTAVTLLTVLISLTALGQDITGQWYGALKVQGIQLRLGFNISNTGNGLTSTMDSPDQGANGIPRLKAHDTLQMRFGLGTK